MQSRRNFLNELLTAGAGFMILPGAGRIWRTIRPIPILCCLSAAVFNRIGANTLEAISISDIAATLGHDSNGTLIIPDHFLSPDGINTGDIVHVSGNWTWKVVRPCDESDSLRHFRDKFWMVPLSEEAKRWCQSRKS